VTLALKTGKACVNTGIPTLSNLCDWLPPRSQVLGRLRGRSCSSGPSWWGRADWPSRGATLEQGETLLPTLARRNMRSTMDTSRRCQDPQS